MRPPALLEARERFEAGELTRAEFKRAEIGGRRGAEAPGGRRARGRHRRGDAAALVPEPAPGGRRRIRRVGHRRVPLGRVALRPRDRRPDGRAPANRRRRAAEAPPLPFRRGARLRPQPHRPGPQGRRPEPVRQLLRPGTVARCLPQPGGLRRRREILREEVEELYRRAGRPTSSSTRRTTRCSSTPATATSTRAAAGQRTAVARARPGLRRRRHRRPSGRNVRFHLCRGNPASRWLVEGGYDWLARRLFGRVKAQRLLLEYDDAHSGGFEPLAEAPEDTICVLGLVTTKTPQRETVDELAGRIREAARVVPRWSDSPSPRSAASPRSSATR